MLKAPLTSTIFFTAFTDIDAAWGFQVSAKQNLLTSFSRTLFIWSGWNWMRWWSSSSWTSWDYFWIRFIEMREIMLLHRQHKQFQCWHAFGHIWISLIQTFSLSVSCLFLITHTHSHAHAHTHTHTHTQTRICTHTHTQSHTLSLSLSLALCLFLTHICAREHIHSHSHWHTLSSASPTLLSGNVSNI